MSSKNPSHKPHLNRLNRIIGQIEAIKSMIEKQDYCVDILVQIKASRNAMKSLELEVLKTHMNACLSKACQKQGEEKEQKINEIMALLKKYE